MAEEQIVAMWGQHYSGILNCIEDDPSKNALLGNLQNISLQGFRSATFTEMNLERFI